MKALTGESVQSILDFLALLEEASEDTGVRLEHAKVTMDGEETYLRLIVKNGAYAVYGPVLQ